MPGTHRCVDDLVGPGRGHGREAGYTMVMFVIIIALMSIAMGVAVQTAAFQMQREREAELIFRGQQFIEAIRLYKIKYGRYPMQLKEIYEAKPRVIRKRWKDPITDSENWGIIFLGQQGRQLGGARAPGSITGPGGRPIGTQPPFGGAEKEPGDVADGGGFDESGLDRDDAGPRGGQSEGGGFGEVTADRKVGPIVGVHSTSCDEAIKVFEGHTTYCEWRFIYKEEQGPTQPARRRGPRPRGVHPSDWLQQTPGAGGPGSGPVEPPPGGPPGPIQTPNP